ncbi:hypothetical protein TEA_029872 [Camellia sinensis var. sinensis]|uniref:INO80 complex subunit B-like conserved region domain-containing protein n=1 Tax=Camellia sinensis var. sinensis TaxID=542762 RepID=A0A4S4EX61_CAMSN|nr:hypothetical protein TEA_029872 [Camellia sinensis var. sinensis]
MNSRNFKLQLRICDGSSFANSGSVMGVMSQVRFSSHSSQLEGGLVGKRHRKAWTLARLCLIWMVWLEWNCHVFQGVDDSVARMKAQFCLLYNIGTLVLWLLEGWIHAQTFSFAESSFTPTDNSDEDHSSSPEKGSGLQGVPWKHFSRSDFSVKNVNSSRGPKPEESVPIKLSDNHEPVRKSKRIPKRRLLDGAFEDGDDDGELRYLEKLKISKGATHYSAKYEDDVELRNKKIRKISIDAKKSRSGRSSEDTDYVEEEDPLSDGEPETKRKKQRKDLVDVMRDSTREMAITTRKRALQTGKDISSNSGASSIEFPNGLPPAPPRILSSSHLLWFVLVTEQKDKLSEMEQQLKKAEAAQRRRIQVEKAARESQAEAIRKILGQDSSRKKREDKMKKRQEDLAQERAASALTLASNTVRWVMGPTGTVVIFPNEMGLPTIFEPKACSYPPPRERCAGPSCTNPYKYRDSKSKLPLCSLQCYKAIHQKLQAVTSC